MTGRCRSNAALFGHDSRRGTPRAYEGAATPRSREMWAFRPVGFARTADETGTLGIRVKKPSELAGALDRGRSAGRPVVIDVHTDIDVIAPAPVV